ncbi:MAG TPA: nucleoside deaminase [Chitinophagaceae bacterium]|nr:nucleoside deaminase [Chitinophagaceae bacterium]
MADIEHKFMDMAIDLSQKGMKIGKGGPFGCVIVKDGVVVGQGCNEVLATNDPTAHAEIVAIRDACNRLNHFQLTGCDIYSSCEPCPMCLGAIYWSRPSRVIFANSRSDAAAIEFDDDFIYNEVHIPASERRIPFLHLPDTRALQIFLDWKNSGNKTVY